jgi:hypothetical protein
MDQAQQWLQDFIVNWELLEPKAVFCLVIEHDHAKNDCKCVVNNS